MIDNIQIRINGKEFNGEPIKVLPNGFILSWKYSPEQISQTGFEIRIGSFSFGLGTDLFVGNIFSYANSNQSRQSYYFYPSASIPRGREVHGQIRLIDQFGEYSDWKYFTSYINDVPHIVSANFLQDSGISNGIELVIAKPNDNILCKTRWYQNGKMQSYLDDSLKVPSRNIEYGDEWHVQIIPFDDIESGVAVDVGPLMVETPEVSGINAEIIPPIPNPDDILEVRYGLVKDGSLTSIGDESYIRWYVNGVEAENRSGGKYARLNMRPGDVVHARIETSWNGFQGQSLMTEPVVVGQYNMQLSNLVINGVNNSISIPYDAVNVVWSVSDNIKNLVKNFAVKIGHSYGGDSVYSDVISGEEYSLFVTPSLLKKGMDYYISIAPVDMNGNVGKYETAYFKTLGNVWSDNVSHDNGYTIFVNLSCNPVDMENTPLDVLSLNISDGHSSFVVDFYVNFVRINIDAKTKIQSPIDNTYLRNYVISVKDGSIFVYSDENLILNYNQLDKNTNVKSLNLIPRGGNGDLKSIVSFIKISTDSAYHESYSRISELTSFSEVIDLPDAVINDLENTPEGIMIATKDITGLYSKVYNYNPFKNQFKFGVEPVVNSFFAANKVSVSPNSKSFAISTSRGISLFKGDPVAGWDASVDFRSLIDLYDNGWISYSSSGNSGISITDNGLLISNSFERTGRSSTVKRNNQLEFPSISFRPKFSLNDFYIVVSSGFISIKSNGNADLLEHSIDLSNYTVSSLVSYMKDLTATVDGLSYIRDHFNIEILNGSGDESAINLIDFTSYNSQDIEHIIYILNVEESIDPYSDSFQTSFSGGKSYIYHDSSGSLWYDSASSEKGYAIEFDVKVENVQDSLRPNKVSEKDIFGIYINDGSYEQEMQLSQNGVFINKFGKRLDIDFTNFTKIRISAKQGNMDIWKKAEDESEYSFAGSCALAEVNGMSRNSKKHVSYLRNNTYYFAWIEEDGDFDVLKYAYKRNNEEWSDPKTIPVYEKSIRSIDIGVDSENVIYFTYETFSFDHSDIFVISKNEYGWSTQFNVTNDRGSSSSPKIFIDEIDNVHLVWSDSRSGIFEIMHAYLDAYSRVWNSTGQSSQIVSSSNYGAYSPAISGRSGNIYVSWTEKGVNGGSQIKISKYNVFEKLWHGRGSLSIDSIVSDSSVTMADKSDIVVDKDGNVHVVYHDLINKNYKIMHRACSVDLNFYDLPYPVVNLLETTDSVNPKIGILDSNGDLILTWIKVKNYDSLISTTSDFDINDPYSANFVVDATEDKSVSNGIYFAKWSREYRSWLSSGSKVSTTNGEIGGYDSLLSIGGAYVEEGACVPKIINSSSVISVFISDYENLNINRLYSYELDVNLPSLLISYDNQDPYSYSLTRISSYGSKKSIVFGDASSYVSGDIYVKSIKYSVSGTMVPLVFRKIGYLTHPVSSEPIINTFVSDDGDCWMINKNGFYYYDFISDQIFNSWSYDLWDNNHLDYIIGKDSQYEIRDVFIDYYGNFYAIVSYANQTRILMSVDHLRWFALSIKDFNIDSSKNLKIAFNKKGIMAVSQIGKTCVIENYVSIYREKAINTSIDLNEDNAQEKLTIILEPSDLSDSPAVSGISNINDLSIDDDSRIFISTDIGLYYGHIGSIVLLTVQDGMLSNSIKSVYIIDQYSRICVYEKAISYMNGSVFEEIPISENYPITTIGGVVSANQTNYGIDAGRFINAIKYGNYIIVCGKNGAIMRFDGDPILERRIPKTLTLGSELLDVLTPEEARNIQIKEMKFNITEELKGDVNLNSYLVEVYLNGNLINIGYEFSAKEEVIYFLTSILPSDSVDIKIRSDFRIDNDFSQNGAEIEAFGTESRNNRMLSYNAGQLYGIITGDSDYIVVKDSRIELPYDEVVLDRKPPVGKVKFISQTGPDSIVLGIDQVVDGENVIPYDEVSGIASMIVSNYDNFTSDGTNPLSPVPFSPVVAHDLLSSLSNNVVLRETETDNFEKIFTFTVPGSVEKTYVVTSSPVKIYERSTAGVFSENPIFTFENGNGDYSIGFVHKMGNSLIFGTKSISGINSGKLYRTYDLNSFEIISILPGSGATCAFISSFDQYMYIGIDGSLSDDPSGYVLRYDGNSVTTYKSRIDKSVASISGIERFLYVGTYDSGYVYRIDLSSGLVEIIYKASSAEIMSLAVLGVAIFAGLSDSGIIVRAKNNDAGFIQSFRTTPSDVQLLKILSFSNNKNILFAAVGNRLYSFRNTWTLEGSSESQIKDFFLDENENIIFCSQKQIKAVQSNFATSRKVFVKLIDNAGNETDIRSAPDEEVIDGYNDNLTLSLTSSQLSSTYLQSKLLEVNNEGIVEFSINGDAPFYSGERIITESGFYHSDIFNGTTGHVSWGRIAWQGYVPEGTSVSIYVRTSDSRQGIELEDFSYKISDNENNVDISFLEGQYLQIKIELTSSVDITPYISKVVVTNNAGSASHFFTTTFPLPSMIKRGIITTEKNVPTGSEIVIGVSGTNSLDFSQYQIVPENRIFSLDSRVQGSNLRVGFRFITPQSISMLPAGEDIGSIEGMGSILSNSVEFDFDNLTGSNRKIDFKIEIFEDANLYVKKSTFDSLSSPNLFRINGNPFPSNGGVSVPSGFSYKFHFIPFGIELSCDVVYYVKVSLIENNIATQYGEIIPFKKICSVNFINNIVFTYVNSEMNMQKVHFEVSFYEDELRTSLFKSFSSQGSAMGYRFLADFFDYPGSGLVLEPGQSSSIALELNSSVIDQFDPDKNYYVTISYFDLSQSQITKSVESMNFTFKAIGNDSSVSCGSVSGAPVLKGFVFMFELEDGRIIKFNYLS